MVPMTEGLVIRMFEETDTDAVAEIWTSVFGYEASHAQPLISIARKLAYQRELFFVAVLNERVVGTVMAGYDGHRGWIYSLAVCPTIQRSGIGSKLLTHAELVLRELNCPKVNLLILQQNHEVVPFYERHGYSTGNFIQMGKVL